MKKIASIACFLGIAFMLLYFFRDTVSLENLKQNYSELQLFFASNITLFSIAFIVSLIVASSLPVPFVAILCIASGALFGNALGMLIVIFGCLTGSLVCFIYVRSLAPEKLIQTHSGKLDKLETELKRAPLLYAICFRCVPGIPFFVGNVLLALSPISIYNFALSTATGMLPTFAVLVLAGSKLDQIESLSDVIDWKFLTMMLIAVSVLISMRILSQRIISSKEHR